MRVVVPASEVKEKTFPVFVWFHGGGKTDIHILPLFVAVVSWFPGWSAGDIGLDDYHLRNTSVELQIVTVNVDYRLSQISNS